MHSSLLNAPRSWQWALCAGLALSAPWALANEVSGAVAPRLAYRSVFIEYQEFGEQAVTPWRERNARVGAPDGKPMSSREAEPSKPNDKTGKPSPTPERRAHGEHEGAP